MNEEDLVSNVPRFFYHQIIGEAALMLGTNILSSNYGGCPLIFAMANFFRCDYHVRESIGRDLHKYFFKAAVSIADNLYPTVILCYYHLTRNPTFHKDTMTEFLNNQSELKLINYTKIFYGLPLTTYALKQPVYVS
jgi:hypothetical protein